jgi:hypothetical protein
MFSEDPLITEIKYAMKNSPILLDRTTQGQTIPICFIRNEKTGQVLQYSNTMNFTYFIYNYKKIIEDINYELNVTINSYLRNKGINILYDLKINKIF